MKVKDSQLERALRTALLVLLLGAAGMTEVYATYDFSAICPTGQTLYYNIIDVTNHYIELTCPGEGMYHSWDGFTRPTGDITLPSIVTYNGTTYSVETIGDFAFRFCSGLTGSLTIPNSVTTIGDYAFSGCSGFTGNLIIGNSVTSIGQFAFYYCEGFTDNLTIPNSVTSIGSCAFNFCRGFTGSLTFGNSVTTIGYSAFRDCSNFTGSLTIPNSVTTIGELAFENCSGFTGSLTIPNSVTTIDRQAFMNCNGFSEVYYNAVNCEDVSSTCITYSWFPFDGVRGTLTIGNDVERIPAHLFRNSLFTGQLTIPNSVISIGERAFYGCSSFSDNLTIGNSVTTIGNHAFYGCSGFSVLYFDAIHCEDGTDNYTHPFTGISGQLIIGNNVERIPGRTFNWGQFTGSLTIPNSVTEIGDLAFCQCRSFTGNLIISNSVTRIGESAFAVCDGFSGVYYSGDIAQWCSISFANSTSNPLCNTHNLYINNTLMTDLIIPESVIIIKDNAFYGCTCFTSLTIPTSITEIGVNAFSNCSGLITVDYYAPNCTSISDFSASPIVTVNIGENVQTIPPSAFANCTTLNTIIALAIMPPALGSSAFSNISPVATLFVPCGSQMAYFSNWNMFEYNNIHEDCTPRPVSIDSNITGGSVTPSVSQASMGQEVMLTVIPNPGMQLVSITANNTNNSSQIVPISPIGNSYRFVMPPYAVTVSATFESTNTLLEESYSIEANIYPNPTNGLVKIEAENIRQICISNMLGQVIYNSNTSNNEFEYDFNQHGEGLYLIRIETANGIITKRIAVTR